MLKIIGIAAVVLVVVVGVLLIYAATRPDTFRIERSAVIKAPPEKIFAFINDFHQWTAWSPWEKVDPALKRSYTGASSGKGAAYAWEGNNKVGSGRMEILESVPASRIAIKLDFLKPFEAHNTAEFTLAPAGGGTAVTWAMHGPSPYMSKVMGIVFNMDKMVGAQFEQGLANLKANTET
jgi:uncharacterized protein YndB with AHSA1/START domain